MFRRQGRLFHDLSSGPYSSATFLGIHLTVLSENPPYGLLVSSKYNSTMRLCT